MKRPGTKPAPPSAPAAVGDRASPLPESAGSYAEAVYQALQREIAEGDLPEGARLREVEVAARFGVSRTPAREALKRLEAEGLLADLPGRGLTVSNPSLHEILDSYLVREVLEGLAARLAAERANEIDLIKLETIFQQVVAFDRNENPERFVEVSRSFDEALFQAAHSPRLYKTIQAARAAQGSRARLSLRGDPVRQAESIEERGQILEAIRKRNPLVAEKAARKHLQRARERRIALTIAEDMQISG